MFRYFKTIAVILKFFSSLDVVRKVWQIWIEIKLDLKRSFSLFDPTLRSQATYSNVISSLNIHSYIKCLKQTLISIKLSFKWYARWSIFEKLGNFPIFSQFLGKKIPLKWSFLAEILIFTKNFPLPMLINIKCCIKWDTRWSFLPSLRPKIPPPPPKKSVVPQGEFLNSFAKILCFTHSKSKESIEKCVLIYLTI